MGVFSWECKECSKSILSPHSHNQKNSWMSKAVAILPNGTQLTGTYDAYGRLQGEDIVHTGSEPDLYHAKCHELSGKPTKYRGGSEPAQDQGFFFKDKDYDFAEPTSLRDVYRILNYEPDEEEDEDEDEQ